MRKREIDKSETRTVSLPLSVWETVEHCAEEHYGGKRSSYIRALVNGDTSMLRKSSLSDPEIITQIVEHFRPAVACEIGELLKDTDQQLLMDQIVDQLVDAWRSAGEHDDRDVVVMPRHLYFSLLRCCRTEQVKELAGQNDVSKNFRVPLEQLFDNPDKKDTGPDSEGRNRQN